MFDSHTFRPVTFWSLGPLKNPKGVTIAVAEIGEVWILRWCSPGSEEMFLYCSDYQKVIEAVKLLY